MRFLTHFFIIKIIKKLILNLFINKVNICVFFIDVLTYKKA